MEIKFGDTVRTKMCDKAVVIADRRDTIPWGHPFLLKALKGNAMYNKGQVFEEKLENILEVLGDKDRAHAIQYQLLSMLNECLESANQEGGVKQCEYDPKKQEFKVIFDVVEVPEDNYVGFQSY